MTSLDYIRKDGKWQDEGEGDGAADRNRIWEIAESCRGPEFEYLALGEWRP